VISSRNVAIKVAQRIVFDGKQRQQLINKLAKDDMLGLECAETVIIEKLTTSISDDAIELANWFIENNNQQP